MTEPTIRNKAHRLAKEHGWEFSYYLNYENPNRGIYTGRVYLKEVPGGRIYLRIPKGNRQIRLSYYGELCIEVHLSRRDWLRWASTWEGELRQLVSLSHRMKISEERLKK